MAFNDTPYNKDDIMTNMDFLSFTNIVKAKDLMLDDWFRMGGNICRVVYVSHNKEDKTTTIEFRLLGQKYRSKNHHLTVPNKTMLKIYNQK